MLLFGTKLFTEERNINIVWSLPLPLLFYQLGVGTLLSAFCIKVLQLFKVPPFCDQWCQCRWVLADTIPAPRCIAHTIFWIGDPVLGLLGYIEYLEDPQQTVLCCVNFFPVLFVQLHAIFHIVVNSLVEERLCHHRCGRSILVEAELLAQRVVITTVVRKH